MKAFKNNNILILSHFSERSLSSGFPPEEIKDFFLNKVKSIAYIEHPFPYAKDHRSSMLIYEDGVLKNQIFTPQFFGPETLFYIIDFFITFYFIIKAWRRFDLCVALDNLNTVSVLPFRKFGIVKKLVFYTIDYTPQRFKNRVLNYFYHLADKIACYHADKIWVVSDRMISARKKYGVDIKKSVASIVLPMGANLSRINILPIEKINRHDIIFIGHLLKKQGVQIVLKALSDIVPKFSDLKFIIIGQGEYEQKLKLLTRKLKISSHVEFKGFINSHKLVENILCKSAIGVALYSPTKDNYTFYTDPGKPKLYIGCGLPIIITDVPKFARVVQKRKAGIMVDYNVKSLKNALMFLLTSDNYKKYRANAIKLAKEYNTESLIQKALVKS